MNMILWSECVPKSDFEGFETVDVVEDIVTLGKNMGLEGDNADAEGRNLVEEHNNELTTEELELHQKEQKKKMRKEISLKKEGRIWLVL